MNNMKKYIIVFHLFFFIYFANFFAQNMMVENVSIQISDMTAVSKPCLDSNGDTCAVLKIKTNNIEGLTFPNRNQYAKFEYSGDGVYLVYVPTSIGRKLDIKHDDYNPVNLDMSEFGFRRLKSGKTYLINLRAANLTEKGTIIIKLEPVQATIKLGSSESRSIIQELTYSANGVYEIHESAGSYYYEVTAENYQPKTGTISLKASEVKTMPIRLTPIITQVLFECNVKNAHVFVDNVDYGRVGNLPIPNGRHVLRLQAEGYLDAQKDITINSYTTNLSFVLEENKQVTHIHATPVKIYSSSSSIYKNNKKIKEWYNGATIMFMPGKYKLTDDYGKGKKIVVGSEPMEIHL